MDEERPTAVALRPAVRELTGSTRDYDSLLGLIYTAPGLAGQDQLARVGVILHAFEPAKDPAAVPGGR